MSIEQKYVFDTYNIIAKHFDKTRVNIWSNVQEFIDNIDSNSFVADIGCGNGKNMSRNDCYYIGIDFCRQFCELAYKRSLSIDTATSNCLTIPLTSNMFDYTLSIAVIHHFHLLDDRIKAVEELIRITKSGGKIIIQVWGFDNKKYDNQDAMIPWKLQKKYNNDDKDKTILRYYHLFIEGELEQIIPKDSVKIIKCYNSYNNWIIELQKN